MEKHTICVLKGDQTGQELLDEALRVLDPSVIRMNNLAFEAFDLSLENRRQTQNGVVHEAARRVLATGLGIKAATITPGDPDDVGSPNALLRELVQGSVILRRGRRIPSVRPLAGVHAPIAVVRMAVEGAYAAQEWREGEGLDEVAYNKRRISRRTCRAVAEFTFRYAQKHRATVFGGPKYTVSPVYEGMFKEELDRAAAKFSAVRYNPQLIDATYALLLETSGEALVIPALNRDGDALSDLVIKMFGTIAGAESVIIAFDEDFRVKAAITEAPHGTAPSLQGKNIANPMAMILACAALLRYIDSKEAAQASRALYEATLESVYNGIKTPDLGGQATTSEFTDEVIREARGKLEVWDALGE
ncbi:MAG: isocitrate/isopropylmalate family dehydrogenase [Chloroflexi bacterium]|nr:isocitrate/isopropylmalate family dehydrogenase [Chloroflexota bacterium]MCY3581309.1 isocitrate/isopropylmalate family dehydrogenase [Chloroflexota bacterium]MCY3716701.1 isocitrate/isopropylmalate family dehydrogenase [Chloroflexota bacterium]MDE2649351.1 isocitrate/isopropylmalate family dehydrogenase [Chloroflexota bacterium]MXX84620.1 isocitrate dehydrogenase [Chloroflexota bacterium]